MMHDILQTTAPLSSSSSLVSLLPSPSTSPASPFPSLLAFSSFFCLSLTFLGFFALTGPSALLSFHYHTSASYPYSPSHLPYPLILPILLPRAPTLSPFPSSPTLPFPHTSKKKKKKTKEKQNQKLTIPPYL
ncbi:hypothetical protein NX059_002394 [Plenodomus lindquistii]|nr:hypothetical protein NX059_002394 [Plenodomus lindquistii]